MKRKHGIAMTAVGMAAVLGLSACGSEGKGSDDKKPTKAADSAPAKDTAAGNGVEKLSGKEINDKAKTELRNAGSLRFKMTSSKNGEQMKIDLALDRQGNCAGTVATPTTGSAEVIKLGDKVWLKADEKLWASKGNPQAAELFKGRYVSGPTSDPSLSGMTKGCNLAAMQAQMGQDDGGTETITKGAVTTVDGQQAIPISAKGTTISVATTGKPYPLKIEDTKDGNVTTLTDWDKPVTAKAPPADQTIDITKLKQSQKQGL
ncbi:hypothetical protein [Streptomyces huiliensis]|uniref:hypothetical protein n=1 Tax=Streptomyces huiliensis TaxID=2876027 RepID=UPI001CBE60E5|nr:hypothetical protein [Streptomyces huiliensis]MBZ4323605.1 hypothetical protein [Streptomyces huiliensis]